MIEEDYDDEEAAFMPCTNKATAVENAFTKQSQRKGFAYKEENYTKSLGEQSYNNSFGD